MWYHNIVKNQEEVEKKFGQFAYRLHELFLAWSTMIARQGSSTVWLMVMTHQHKVDAYSAPRTAITLDKTAMFCKPERFTTKH
jgi:hypothetical protein